MSSLSQPVLPVTGQPPTVGGIVQPDTNPLTQHLTEPGGAFSGVPAGPTLSTSPSTPANPSTIAVSESQGGISDAEFFNLFGYSRVTAPPPPPFGQWVQPYNSMQLASYAQARTLAAAINSLKIQFATGDPRPMGGGVQPGDDELTEIPPLVSPGIYKPSWASGSPFPQPSAIGPDGTQYWTLCLRFKNGMSGMNVGLILDKFSRYPLSPNYVIGQIAAEAEQ
jgi:hypothetical protein